MDSHLAAKADTDPRDDRVTCRSCTSCLVGHWRCTFHQRGVMLDVPLRCMGYQPRPGEPDQRSGAKRWPTLDKEIAEVRKIDLEFAHR